jgi:hypothetical protein
MPPTAIKEVLDDFLIIDTYDLNTLDERIETLLNE